MDETIIYGLLADCGGSEAALEFRYDPDITGGRIDDADRAIAETEARMIYSDYGSISIER